MRIVSRYVGCGFGGKLPVFGDVTLSALTARQLGGPVKTAPTHQQIFHFTTHRSQAVKRVRMGATADGRFTAIGHHTWQHCARFDNICEPSAMSTRTLYAVPNRLTTHRLSALDMPVAESTHAPGEAVDLLALEQAMDELAEKPGLDPVELRLRNEPKLDPDKQVPYSPR